LAAGHKMRTSYDFGRAILDILYAFPEDTGVYNCVATNELGQDVTECELNVKIYVLIKTCFKWQFMAFDCCIIFVNVSNYV